MARKLEMMKGAWLATAYTLEDTMKFFVMGFMFGIGFHLASWVIDSIMMNWMGVGLG